MTNLIFFGTPEFALPALKLLHQTGLYNISVVTAPDKLVGRKRILTPPKIKTEALKLGLPVFQPATLKDEVFFNEFTGMHAEIAVVTAYGKIIPENYINALKYGFVNIHPSLLPKYRGPTPIQSAILQGEKESGVSIMLIDKDVDHGPILATAGYRLETTGYYPEITEELAELGAKLLVETLPIYFAGKLHAIPQKHEMATYTAKFTREDGRINWEKPADEIHNRIRALNPDPGVWTEWGGKILRILKTKPLPFCVISTGTFGHVARIESYIAVQTGSCPLELLEVQPEGAKAMAIGDFLNGHPDFLGAHLGKKL